MYFASKECESWVNTYDLNLKDNQKNKVKTNFFMRFVYDFAFIYNDETL